MHVTNKRDPIKNYYTIHGVTLQEIDGTKYFGVNLYKSLSWNNHIDQVAKNQSFSSGEHLGHITRKYVLEDLNQSAQLQKLEPWNFG